MSASLPIIALCISALSLIFAGISLGWNIYRDAVMKPRLRVHFGVKQLHHDIMPRQTLIVLGAVNFGPGQVTCSNTALLSGSLIKRLVGGGQWSIVVPAFGHPLCFKLPHRLNMAEEMSLIFPYSKECFLKERPAKVGMSDSFGRVHWAAKRDVRKAIEDYARDFGGDI